MTHPLGRFVVALTLAVAATLVGGNSARAQTPPTPAFSWNNFVSAGTQWGNANNWVPAGPPASTIDQILGFGSSPLQTLTGYTASNNLGAFDLNSAVFSANSNVGGGVTVNNLIAADTLRFNTNGVGTLPSLWQVGTSRVTVRHAIAGSFGITLAGGATGTTLQVLGGGTGDVYLDAGITQTGAGASGLLINQTGARNFFTGSAVRLGGSNSNYTGGVTLTAGNLMLSNVVGSSGVFAPTVSVAATPITALGTGALTVNGGSLQFDPAAVSSGTSPSGATGTLQLNNAVVLNGTLSLTGVITAAVPPSGNFAGILAGTISGAGGLTIAPTLGTVNYALTGANTFTGPLVIQPIGTASTNVFLGTANVAGGTLAGTTAITVGSGGALNLNNTFGVLTRLNTTTAPGLTLNGGTLNLLGNPTANASETFDALTVVGMGNVSAFSGTSAGGAAVQSASLTFASLNRGPTGTGTLNIAGTNLGSGTGSGEGVVVFTANPGGAAGGGTGTGTTTRSILPYAVANSRAQSVGISATLTPAGTTLNALFPPATGSVFGLVRYDTATGRLVPLDPASEYASNLYLTGTAAPAANLRLASDVTFPSAFGAAGIDRPTTVNALVLDTNQAALNPVGVSVQGSGVLTVAGGAVLVGNNGGNTSNILNPSLINTGGLNFGATPGYFHTASALTVNAPITGSGGVVKSQPGSLILNAVNPFTGGLFVNNGPLQFSTDANLGAAGQPVTLNGGATNGLQFLPSNLFGPATAGNVTVDRPITLGAGGGGVFVSLVNDTLTLSGVVSGPGQLVKAGLGVLNLTGANTYTGNTLVSAGILTAANDAALGGAGSNIVLGGTALGNGVFQPTGSFTTSRDILVSATTVLFTGGQNLTVAGNVTSPGLPGLVTLFKTGTGDLTLTAANTFTGAFQLGESTPTVRATAAAGAQTGGRLILSGANGALASASSVFSISNSELILDNTAVANANRLGNVTLSLIGGNATLLGNAATSVNEQIGALSIANGNNQYGGRLTLVTPAGSGQVTTLTATAPYSAQTAPSVGTLFVRGTNLGATTGDRTAVVLPANPAQTNNMIPSILLATSDTAADPTDFASTATITNAAPNSNQFRLVPFATYTAGTGSLGAGVAANTYDVTGAATFAGTSAANALRLNNTSTAPSVDLGGGTLTLTAGNVLTTGGANGGITNGTLAYAATVAARFSVATGSDLVLGANVSSSTGGFTKLGGGVLTLNNPLTTTTGLIGIAAGTLKYGNANVLPITAQPFLNAGAGLDLNNTNSTLGGLIGWGDVTLGTGTLTLNVGTAPILAYGGGLVGTGTLVKTGTALQIFAGNSTAFSGGVQILGGQLTVNSSGGLGTGTSPILLGDTAGTVRAQLAISSAISAFNRDLTVQAGSTPGATTPHTFTVSASTTTLGGNFALGQNLRLNNSSNNTGNASLNGVISGVGRLEVFFGSWTFNGNNTYSGGTRVDTGNTAGVGAGSDTAFGTGPLTFSLAGANLRADGGTRTLANNLVLETGGYFGVVGTNPLVFNGGVDLSASTAAQSFNVQNTALTTINGAIANGTGGVAKNGPGTLAFGGVNTYTGTTTVNAGRLQLVGAGVTPGATSVNPGAVFGGTGTAVGLVTVNPNAVLAPGNLVGVGTLTAQGGVTTAAGAIFAVRLANASTPAAAGTGGSTLGALPNPTSNTFLNLAGTTSLSSGTVTAIDGTGLNFALGTQYSYLVAQGAGSQAGLPITNASQFATIGFTADPALFSLTEAGGNVYLNFTPVPEPTTILALAAAFGVAARRLRRRAVAA